MAFTHSVRVRIPVSEYIFFYISIRTIKENYVIFIYLPPLRVRVLLREMNRDLLRDGVLVLVRVTVRMREFDRDREREEDGRLEGVRVKLLRDGVIVVVTLMVEEVDVCFVGVTGYNVLV